MVTVCDHLSSLKFSPVLPQAFTEHVELVREIRDRQAEALSDKSAEEIMEFFRKAGEAARREALASRSGRSRSEVRPTVSGHR